MSPFSAARLGHLSIVALLPVAAASHKKRFLMVCQQEDEDVRLERRGDLLAPLKVLVCRVLHHACSAVAVSSTVHTLEPRTCYNSCMFPGQQMDKETLGSSPGRVSWHGYL